MRTSYSVIQCVVIKFCNKNPPFQLPFQKTTDACPARKHRRLFCPLILLENIFSVICHSCQPKNEIIAITDTLINQRRNFLVHFESLFTLLAREVIVAFTKQFKNPGFKLWLGGIVVVVYSFFLNSSSPMFVNVLKIILSMHWK